METHKENIKYDELFIAKNLGVLIMLPPTNVGKC